MKQGYIINPETGKRAFWWQIKQFCQNPKCGKQIKQPLWTHRIQKYCSETCKQQHYNDTHRKIKNHKTGKWTHRPKKLEPFDRSYPQKTNFQKQISWILRAVLEY